jgi:DNA-binding transcriptional LysR family regulator
MRAKFDWSDLRVLLAFARTGTLADAGADLGMDETTASRRLKRLEAALGIALTSREVGKLRLTSAGRVAVERAETMEQAAEDLERAYVTRVKPVVGSVRITSLGYVLNHVVIPALPNLQSLHPGITINIQSDNRNLSLEANETDIAIRMAAPTTATYAAEKVADLAFALYRPRNRFHGVPPRRCLWVGPSSEYATVPEAAWLEANIPADRIIMRSNANICNAAAVKAGMVCAVLPSLIGDNDRDMVRMDGGRVLHREIWLVRRVHTDPTSAIGVTVEWLQALFRDLEPQLAG